MSETTIEQGEYNTTELNATVHFVLSRAPLLSGELTDCLNAQDESCQGGIAAVAAYSRHYGRGLPSLVLPFADRDSPFVQMHPLVWNVNRFVFQEIFGFRLFSAPPSLLTQHREDFDISQRDLSGLQSKDFPYLLSNVAIPPSISWSQFTIPIFFDDETGLAVLVNINDGQPMTYSQVESTLGLLDYIALVNARNGCHGNEYGIYEIFLNRTHYSDSRCWLPVVVFADVQAKYDAFKRAVVNHVNKPALIIDTEGNDPSFATPRQVDNIWILSFVFEANGYYHHRLTLSSDRKNITEVKFITENLEGLNDTLKDEEYVSSMAALREQADKATANNPVVGQSTFMPASRDDTYRRCKAGECELGNLFTDAIRWWANADFAITSSGGFRGPGWEAGDIRVSDIWGALPFPNNPCTGTMNGISVFKLFNYSINAATFEGENTNDGDRLLQVSGMKVLFNLEREGNRLVSIEIWDTNEDTYAPLEKLKLYKFATDSYLCGGFDPFPGFLVQQLSSPGEEPGVTSDALLIQDIVADYLLSRNSSYETVVGDRIINDTSATASLNFVQTADDCRAGTFWQDDFSTCEPCPDGIGVSFLSEVIEFEGVQGSNETIDRQVSMVNSELDEVMVVPKSKPAWLEYAFVDFGTRDRVQVVEDVPIPVQSGERITYSFRALPSDLEAGTAQGTVAFAVLNAGNYPGCAGQDARFEVLMRVSPMENFNYLGSIRYLGITLALVAALTSLFLSAWVWYYRNLRIVKTLQPFFLITISFGMLVMALANIPLSIDDEKSSQRACDIACMASPWLLSMGFTVSMSALFSKLWRINRLFGATSRRMKVREKDVMAPFALLFTLNFTFMLVWTLVDPLQWVRLEISGEPWNTYGACRSNDDGDRSPVSFTMSVLVVALNIVALLAACKQAYQARNISDEFSEAKNMGIGLFSWFQLIAVGLPMLFLIDHDNVTARYFLQVLLIFAISLSMLLLIFVPMMIQAYKVKKNNGRHGTDRNQNTVPGSKFSAQQVGTIRVSGLDGQRISRLTEDLDKLSYHDVNPNADLRRNKYDDGSKSSLGSINESIGDQYSNDTPWKGKCSDSTDIIGQEYGKSSASESSDGTKKQGDARIDNCELETKDLDHKDVAESKAEDHSKPVDSSNTDDRDAEIIISSPIFDQGSHGPPESAPSQTKVRHGTHSENGVKLSSRQALNEKRKELQARKLELEKRDIVYFR